MNVLFIDTSNDWLTTALFTCQSTELEAVFYRHSLSYKEASYRLILEIEQAIQTPAIEKPDCIVTCTGPGSFTGIRICVATARNLSQIWQIPVLGLDSLELYAHGYPNDQQIILLNARQKKIYAGILANGQYSGSMDVLPESFEQQYQQTLNTGMIYTNYDRYLARGQDIRQHLPDIRMALSHYLARIQQADYQTNHYSRLLPTYLRASYAEENKKNEKKQHHSKSI